MSVTTYLSTLCQIQSICILHLAIMNNIEQSKCHSVVCQMWGDIISFTQVKLTFPYISYQLTFPYIFLLLDCFEWALIGHIELQRVHSVL